MKKRFILQKIDSAEIRAVSHYAATSDNIKVIYSEYSDLPMYIDELKQGAIPVGSVEFVQYVFKLMDIEQPKFDCYDDIINKFLKRQIVRSNLEYLIKNIIHDVFIKPEKLKQFNGFVFKGLNHIGYDGHDLEQITILKSLSCGTIIIQSEVVNFIAEWCCYITNGELKACCRYDDNEEDYDFSMPEGLIDILKGKTIAADIGLMINGEYAIVELNDAWAIGKYKGISNRDYFEF